MCYADYRMNEAIGFHWRRSGLEALWLKNIESGVGLYSLCEE